MPEVINLPKKYSSYGFTGLVENENNKSLIEIGKNYFEGKVEKKSLVMCGNVGSGKTRLAVAILRNMKPIEKNVVTSRWRTDTGNEEKTIPYTTPARSLFITADEFFQRCNESTANYKSKIDYIKDVLAYDVCCLDDLGIENFTPAKQENLYLFVNQAYMDERSIIITTNFLLEELEKIEPRITDRLREMALILKFDGKSFR